jgi:hypothetical protein
MPAEASGRCSGRFVERLAICTTAALCVVVAYTSCLDAKAWAKAAGEGEPMTAEELRSKLNGPKPVVISDKVVTGAVELDGGSLTTQRVTFRDKVTIIFGGDSGWHFVDTTFSGLLELFGGEGPGFCLKCSLIAENASFNGRVSLAPKSGKVELVDSTFARSAQFTDTFSSLACRGCTFKSPANFGGAHIDKPDFRDTVFEQPADFSDASITGPRFSCFRGKPIYVTWEQFGEEWIRTELGEARSVNPKAPYQQLKTSILCWRDNFKSIGFERDAKTANYEAIKVTREHLEDPPSLAWLSAWIPEVVDGWGTRPWQPFVVATLVVLLYWAIFWIMNPFAKTGTEFKPITPLALFAFFFSLETFVPIFKVTGVKEWGWATTGAGRWVEVSEALLGGILSAFAAYSFVTNVL